MRNGGGPACLRLRVPVGAAALTSIHPGYLLNAARLERLERLVESCWPVSVTPSDLTNPALWESARAADIALTEFISDEASVCTP